MNFEKYGEPLTRDEFIELFPTIPDGATIQVGYPDGLMSSDSFHPDEIDPDELMLDQGERIYVLKD